MVPTMKSVLAMAIIASIACSAVAWQNLHCYNCDSSRDPECGEKFKSQDRFKIDCSVLAPSRAPQFGTFLTRNATGCMKRVFDVPGQYRVERTCFFGDPSHTQIGCAPELSQYTQRVLTCDVCTGNLCNGAGALAPVGFAIVLFFALTRIFA